MLFKLLSIPILIFAIAFGWIYTNNPYLFGQKTDAATKETFEIFKHSPELDEELFELAKDLGSDFTAYRNHCLRVLTFTNYFLTDEVKKEIPQALSLAATALAYHDVGLWTDKKLSYLDPSVRQLVKVFAKQVDPKDLIRMREMILNHHKFTDFESPVLSKADKDLINAVRKADWADFTMGIVRFGMPAALIEQAYEAIPEAGFHKILMGLPPKLSPGDFMGQMRILDIFKW